MADKHITEFNKARASFILGSYSNAEQIIKSESKGPLLDAEKKKDAVKDYENDQTEEGIEDDKKSKDKQGTKMLVKAESAVKKARQDSMIQKSIESMIEKGEISDTLGRGYGSGSEPIKFKKTGKEIKEKIPAIITMLTTEQTKIQVQLEVLAEQIGVAPTENRNSSFVKGIIYNQYPWAMCEAIYDNANKCYGEKTDQMDQCCKYNSLAYLYCSISEDLLSCQVIASNVEDKTSYTLSTSQLVALGF